MPIIPMKAAVLVSGPFVWVTFQLVRPSQRCVVSYLYEDLVKWDV